MEQRSVADVEGAWKEPGFESGLISRCRENWKVPIPQVSNYVLATFLRQRIALSIAIPEAERRVGEGFRDETELFDEELMEAVSNAKSQKGQRGA